MPPSPPHHPILSHTTRAGCSHFLCCFLPCSTPRDTGQRPGKGAECQRGHEHMAKGLSERRWAFAAGNTQVHAVWNTEEGAREVDPDTGVPGEGGVCSVRRPASWLRAKPAGTRTAGSSRASSVGHLGAACSGEPGRATGPRGERRQALDHSHHRFWPGACGQVTGGWTTTQMIKGPEGVTYGAG